MRSRPERRSVRILRKIPSSRRYWRPSQRIKTAHTQHRPATTTPGIPPLRQQQTQQIQVQPLYPHTGQPQQLKVRPLYPTQASHNNSRYTTNTPAADTTVLGKAPLHHQPQHSRNTTTTPAANISIPDTATVSHTGQPQQLQI
jgi:hypothetical protein